MAKGGNPKKTCPSCGVNWQAWSQAQRNRHLERCLG
jgi:hypothetical protein